MHRSRHRFYSFIWTGLPVVIAPHLADGSTVLPMTIQQLADAAGQAIDAVVETTTSAWSDDRTTIRTTVRFREVHYLKGRLPDSTDAFELVVPGGTVGDIQLRLTGAPRFEAGQRWLLFLRPIYNVHPVVGIFRGAFRIEDDSIRGARILNSAGSVVVGIDGRGFIRSAVATSLSEGRPRQVVGATSESVVRVVEVHTQPVTPMSYEQFLDRIRPVLLNSRDHGLTAPAGRPTRRRAHAVPLRVRDPRGTNPKANGDEARETAQPVTTRRGRKRGS